MSPKCVCDGCFVVIFFFFRIVSLSSVCLAERARRTEKNNNGLQNFVTLNIKILQPPLFTYSQRVTLLLLLQIPVSVNLPERVVIQEEAPFTPVRNGV